MSAAKSTLVWSRSFLEVVLCLLHFLFSLLPCALTDFNAGMSDANFYALFILNVFIYFSAIANEYKYFVAMFGTGFEKENYSCKAYKKINYYAFWSTRINFQCNYASFLKIILTNRIHFICKNS